MFNRDKEFVGRKPDYVSRDGVNVWVNLDKNGKKYLKIKIPILGISVVCFPSDYDLSNEESSAEGSNAGVEVEKIDIVDQAEA
ncbi:hypothetical protein GF327_09590 [Candidatus Woesearchaeota archaeon]|nr:hypothetical protein [Candidatus Woesearchaeota archaeon]